jgi:hypothetical protein
MAVYDGGGGTGSGSGSWVGASVPDMWAALANYDSTPHLQMTGAWRQSYELLSTHISQVKQYRENLITAWPPHKSKAAAAYVLELDGLIENLKETYEAAISNHRALSTATSAIMEARRELEAIQKEYASNAVLLTQYNGAQTQSTPTPTPTPSPSPQSPPVAPGRQAQLQLQAASLMQSLSAELATAQTSFVAPRPYKPSASFSDNTDTIPTGGGVPLMTPSFTPRNISPTRGSKTTSPTSGGVGPSGGNTDGSGTHKQPTSEGPILGGAKPASNTTIPALPTPPTSTTNTIPSTSTSPGGPFNFTPPTNPTSSSPISRYPTTNSSSVGGSAPGNGTRGGSYPNGIIGGSPAAGGSGRGSFGQSGTTARGGQRVNPAGGVIGGQGHDGTSGHPGRRQHSRSDEDPQNRRWDPDNPWETTDGVDPVLLPSPEQRIDPGPTIGGR